MKKVLIISPIYPSASDPLQGSFVLEQMRLIDDIFDFRVLVSVKKEIGKAKFRSLISKPHQLLKMLASEDISKDYDQSWQTAAIRYPYFSFYLPWGVQYARVFRAFDKQLFKLVSEGWRPDLIHAHYSEDAGVIAHYLSRKHRVPYILTEHNALQFCDGTRRSKEISGAIQGASRLVLVSNDQKRRLVTHMYDKSSATVLGNFVDEELFMPGISCRKKEFTVLYVGYPHPLKDMRTLFETIDIFKARKVSGIRFLIVSPVEATSYFPQGLQAYVEDKALNDYCVLFGRVDRERMPALINASDLVLSTSISETFGLSLVEALMCGRPVVCTNSGGPQDFVNDQNGIMVNIMDPQALAEAILKVKNREPHFVSRAIRAQVLKKFGKKSFRARLVNSYVSAMTEYRRNLTGSEIDNRE